MIDQQEAESIHRQLHGAGFDGRASRSQPQWYTCVAVSMVWQPGTRDQIIATAETVARHLGWQVIPRRWYPCWHLGHSGPRKYFHERVAHDPPQIGINLTFDDLEPYCASHDRPWRDSDSCTGNCHYGLRLNDCERKLPVSSS